MIARHWNRVSSRMPRGRGFWCGACDGRRVRAGGKCPACGAGNGKRRARLAGPMPTVSRATAGLRGIAVSTCNTDTYPNKSVAVDEPETVKRT